jgi:hypothetical protein
MELNITYKQFDLVFFHIPKCGGTTLTNELSNFFQKKYLGDEIFTPEQKCVTVEFIHYPRYEIKKLHNYDEIRRVLAHTIYDDLNRIRGINIMTYDDLDKMNIKSKYKITFVRDPIERVISHYYFFDYKQTNIHLSDLPQNEFNKICSMLGCFMCECLGLLNLDNELMKDLIPDRVNEFCFIGCMETYDNDIKQLNQLMHNLFDSSYNLDETNILNKNIEKNEFNKFITKELYERIRPFCEKDYILYNYILNKKRC